jgi:hypothetical protein
VNEKPIPVDPEDPMAELSQDATNNSTPEKALEEQGSRETTPARKTVQRKTPDA